MSEIKWIKITTDIFDDEKILLIESLPDADALIVIWFKLLCLAGKQNNNGVFLINDRIPYTDKMLATIFRRKEPVVQLALQTFEQFGMIETVDGVITIPNWEKHQNIEGLDKAREQNRLRNIKYRERQKQLIAHDASCDVTHDVTHDVTMTLRDATEEDQDQEKERISLTGDKKEKMPDCQEFVNLYHKLCPSLPKVQKLTEGRKSAIKARWREYPDMKTFEKVFARCENNAFMKGNNDRNWVANFDFIFQASSFTKIVEGYYDNMAQGNTQKPTNKPLTGSSYNVADFFTKAVNRKGNN